jgi:hypothetical protein
MTEENETLEILKLLLSKIQKLEETVYDKENLLMKSGFVVASTPVPKMDSGAGIIPDSDQIAKMSWKDINKLVSRLEGQS